MIRYRAIQNKVRKIIETLDDHDYRSQFHQELSPLGWHLGHCLYIENYWLREVLDKDDSLTHPLEQLYIPENCPKPERGGRLPEKEELIKTAVEFQDNNALLLMEMVPPFSDQNYFKDEYIQYFIIQHYAQHYETMQMVLQQRALQHNYDDYRVNNVLTARKSLLAISAVPAGKYDVGSENYLAYDNEQPRHPVELEAYSIAERPVSNAEYLSFMQDDGYQNKDLWSDEGWQWLQQIKVSAPEHWRQDKKANWFGIADTGAHDLVPEHAVFGINFYEASAYARWANARLPHEHEWETALVNKKLPNTGDIWEWCHNRFFAYDGFKAFPYDEYSTPWFEQPHYVLRGGSHFTRHEVKRPSFRNFFGPDKRHIFAGCRLAYD